MVEKQALVGLLQQALSGASGDEDHDSLVPLLALGLGTIVPLQQNARLHPGRDSYDSLENAIDGLETQFAKQLNVGTFYELLRSSRLDVELNRSQERIELLKEIAAEYNTKPLEKD